MVGFYAANFFFSIVPGVTLVDLVIVGLLNGIILLFSILIHELSHSIIAQRYGLKVSEIELYLLGGVSKIEEEPRTPKSEIIISFVGPLSSFLIGFGFLLLLFLPINLPAILWVTFLYSGISNIGLAIFNLIPAFPIDGGRILRAFLWKRKNNIVSATKIASKVGKIFGYGLMVYGLYQILFFGLLNGIWLILIGSYLKNSSTQSYIQTLNDYTLSHISVKEIFNLPQLRIPFNMTLSDALRDFFIPYKKRYFPVIQGEDIVGIIHADDIKKVPIWQRSEFITGYIMRKLSEFPFINKEQTGKEALKKLNQIKDKPHIIRVKEKDDDALVGFIGEEELISSLQFWNLNMQNT